MNILITVEFYYPSVGGAQEAARQIAEHLVILGNKVTIATTKIPGRNSYNINGVVIKEFDISGNYVRGYTGDFKSYIKYLSKSKFDVIINYAAQQWATDLMLPHLNSIKSKKIIIPCGFSGLYEPNYKNYYDLMPEWLKHYDALVFLSRNYRDIKFARKHKINKIYIIPNGADEREFGKLESCNRKTILSKYKIPIGNKIILCISNHTGQKGHKEAIKAFNKSTLKDTSLIFVGDVNLYGGCYKECLTKSKQYNFFDKVFIRQNNSIKLLTLNRKDTLQILSISDIFLFLSNIEASPLVLFEAAAAGVPTIASDCGNSKEIISWLKSGKVSKTSFDSKRISHADIDSAARAINYYMNNKRLRSRISLQARINWQKQFTWEKITNKYSNLCQSLVRNKYENN